MDSRRAWLAVLGLMLTLCLGLFAIFLYGELGTSIRAEGPQSVTVRRGESLTALASRLHQEGLLEDPRYFRFLAVLRGDSRRVKAGEFVVEGRVSPSALIDDLVHGDSRLWRFTIPEGYSLREIADKLEREGKADAEKFLRLARDPDFIAGLQLPIAPPRPTLEGYIFPETYHFSAGTGEAELVRNMVKAFRERAAPLLRQKAAAAGLNPYQALVLASIIEKETGAPEERGLISSVFHNRLKQGMRLYSDPTVIYGLERFDGNLTRKNLESDSPYNTYRTNGLPPTPIANPGLESVLAALEPVQSDYLYFVAKGDGTHHFSKSYKAHSQAVWFYQKFPHMKRKS
ncbi:MAG: endolytic transglycosylase MltG [Candidatus Lambdaproteobacteria bacterium]|nr:endolytic transglycosylase MltG [Candidatus Lambdaproteobacteria bacterium]